MRKPGTDPKLSLEKTVMNPIILNRHTYTDLFLYLSGNPKDSIFPDAVHILKHCFKTKHKIVLSLKLIKYSTRHVNSQIHLRLRPCRSTCSRTMKNCCNGSWSSSNIRPCAIEESISSLTISLETFSKLALSIARGSRPEKKNCISKCKIWL